MMRLKSYISFFVVVTIVSLHSCKSDPLSPGVEYMPDMYRSPSYETYGVNALYSDSMEARVPVTGTIPRGHNIYPYENTVEGYELAGAELRNPLPYTALTLEQGKVAYEKFCVHCHGVSGKGDGKVAQNPKWPGPPPAYDGPQLINLSEGKMYHSIHYGKGNMGSHASQISQDDRWAIIHYIQKLQGKKGEFQSEVKTEILTVDTLTTAEVKTKK